MQFPPHLQTLASGILASAITFVPKLLTALIILIVGWLISKMLASLFQQLGDRFKLEDVFRRIGLTDGLAKAQINRTVTDIIAQFLFWVIFLNFLLIALQGLGLQAAVEPLKQFIDFLPRLFVAGITLVGGSLLAQFVGKATQAATASMGIDFHEQLGGLVKGLVFIIIVIIVVAQLGYPADLLNNLFITLVTISTAGVALAFGLGGRKIAHSILAGYYARDIFHPGDTIEVEGVTGVIESIGAMNIEISVGDKIVVIPSTRLTEDTITIHRREER